jgi:uncharacterized protein YceK
MKKIISTLLVLTMVLALFAGCGGAAVKPTESSQGTPASDAPSEPAAVTDNNIASTGYPIVDSYTAYITAKGEMVTNLTNALSSNDETSMAALSLLGVGLIDMVLLPVSSFGLGKDAAEIGMGYMGATDIQYTENGNSYTVSYKGNDGKTLSLTGVWDAAAGSLACTGLTDGAEDFRSEYCKTSYGYAAQYYVLNSDGTWTFYAVTIQGKDGALGISAASDKPAALTGSETVDYPSMCDEWYAINGTTVTGKASDGTAINFEYVPAE